MASLSQHSRILLRVYGVAVLLLVGFTLWGWLGDCATHELDGQCGMSTAFGAAIGLIAGFIVIALGHWLPALSRSRSRGRKDVSK
jgi:hypothetical protein